MAKTYQDYQLNLVEALAQKLDVGYDQIIPVWFSKVVENAKGLYIVNGSDAYYEVTYHGKRDVYYVDTYLKMAHQEITLEYGE